MVQLIYLGRLVDITGIPEETLDLPSDLMTTGDLRTWLNARFPEADQAFDASVRIALDSEIAAEPAPIGQVSEIAFLPPVGGG
jgi:molybdopterin synthase sulfur carrier subunit